MWPWWVTQLSCDLLKYRCMNLRHVANMQIMEFIELSPGNQEANRRFVSRVDALVANCSIPG